MKIKNQRELRLIKDFKEQLELDLAGAVVLTEMGTGPFMYSAISAAISGAKKVHAIAPDSKYARHNDIVETLEKITCNWQISPNLITPLKSREEVPPGVDIFLNLGFVRPIDSTLLALGSERCVVSYMSEAWEYRPGDVDLNFCNAKNIPVSGVNEDFDGFNVFSSCGQLALKLIFEAGIEVSGCNFGVLSNDPFGKVICKALKLNSGNAVLIKSTSLLDKSVIENLDALIIATYSSDTDLFSGSRYTPLEISKINSTLKIIQFCGSINVENFNNVGIKVYPPRQVEPYRMIHTLSYLGVRPVIALHMLGLKVGEILYRSRFENRECAKKYKKLLQLMTEKCS